MKKHQKNVRRRKREVERRENPRERKQEIQISYTLSNVLIPCTLTYNAITLPMRTYYDQQEPAKHSHPGGLYHKPTSSSLSHPLPHCRHIPTHQRIPRSTTHGNQSRATKSQGTAQLWGRTSHSPRGIDWVRAGETNEGEGEGVRAVSELRRLNRFFFLFGRRREVPPRGRIGKRARGAEGGCICAAEGESGDLARGSVFQALGG